MKKVTLALTAFALILSSVILLLLTPPKELPTQQIAQASFIHSHRILMPVLNTLTAVDSIFSIGLLPTTVDKFGNTLLTAQLQAPFPDVALTEYLLNKGFDPNHMNKDGRTPLMYACIHHRLDLIQLLLEHGARANQRDLKGAQPISYLITPNVTLSDTLTAIYYLLIKHGGNINQQSNLGTTTLWDMIALNKYEIANWAVTHIELNPRLLNLKREHALFQTLYYPLKYESLKPLVEHGIDLYHSNRNGVSLIEHFKKLSRNSVWSSDSAADGNISVINALKSVESIEHYQSVAPRLRNDSLFLNAVASCDISQMNALYTKGISSHPVDSNGYNPYMYLSLNEEVGVMRFKHAPVKALFKSSYKNPPPQDPQCTSKTKKETLIWLISKSFDFRTHDIFGNTVLHHYAANNEQELIANLLSADIDINARNIFLCVPAHYAIAYGYFDLFDKLVDFGTNLFRFNDRGLSFLHTALMVSDSLFESLQSKGLHIDGQDMLEDNSMLHYWAQRKDTVYVNKLLSAGANPNVFDVYGLTPLWYAVKTSKLHHVRSLLKGGARLNVLNPEGITEYDYAVENNLESILRYLSAYGGKAASALSHDSL